LDGKLPYSATQLFPLKKLRGMSTASQREVLGAAIEHVREASIGEEHL